MTSEDSVLAGELSIKKAESYYFQFQRAGTVFSVQLNLVTGTQSFANLARVSLGVVW